MYHFEILNDKEFEGLTKDLLEKHLKIDLQSFKSGKDKGIDLRYSNTTENEIIVQVKHYSGSKYADLKHSLIKKEKPKIEKLSPQPKRYIVVTSLDLNPMQVDELKAHLEPFVRSSNDIYGYDRLCQILVKSKDVEERHPKLWLANSNTLRRILNNAVNGRSEFYQEKILRKASLYVPTQNFANAVETLKKENLVIVTGEPGIGKTTISYLLICHLLGQNFKLVHIDDSIKEAENLLTDPEEKQVFFFDDFLGSNIYEILNPRNTESTIMGFIERIRATKNKYLILTTRTTILNQAEHSYEKLKRSKYREISQYKVELKQYSKLDKAKILYNHIYHSSLPEEYLTIFFEDENYLKIIDHRNYSPRLIEFISSHLHLPLDKDYHNHIFRNLEYPNEIWRGAFENQLDDNERFLLITLFSLGGYRIDQSVLEIAFDSRIRYEIEENGHFMTNDVFNTSIKKLLDGFILSEKMEDNTNQFGFLNPSVGDFLINYLAGSKVEILRILCSVQYIEQVMSFLDNSKLNSISLNESDLQAAFRFFQKKRNSLKTTNSIMSRDAEILRAITSLFGLVSTDQDFISVLELANFRGINNRQLKRVISMLNDFHQNIEVRKIVFKRFDELVIPMYGATDTSDDYLDIKSLFDLYDIDFHEWMENEGFRESVLENIPYLVSNDFEQNLDYSARVNIISLYTEDYSEYAKEKLKDELENQLSDFLSDCDLIEFNDEIFISPFINEEELIEKFVEELDTGDDFYFPPEFAQYYRRSSQKIPSSSNANPKRVISENEKINRLFEK